MHSLYFELRRLLGGRQGAGMASGKEVRGRIATVSKFQLTYARLCSAILSYILSYSQLDFGEDGLAMVSKFQLAYNRLFSAIPNISSINLFLFLCFFLISPVLLE